MAGPVLRDLRIPRMGSVENARLLAWRVAEGEAFAAGQVLYEVETDKTSVEIEADEAGVMAKQAAEPGDEFKVGDRIGLWAPPGTSPLALAVVPTATPSATESPAAAPKAVAPAVSAPGLVKPVPRSAANGRRVSPLARRLAAQQGIDLASVTGTGPGGKIHGRDVLAACAAAPGIADAPDPVVPVRTPAVPAPASAGPVPAEGRLVPHSLRRQTIARRMAEAAAIPSLTADMAIDLSALFALRKAGKAEGSSVFALIAHAAVGALRDHPRLNALWREDGLVEFDTVHLGVAVDTPAGLVVPVVRHAERLSAVGLTQAIAGFAARARDGNLRPDELDGGTFTLSNPGAIGPVIRAEALLNPPQVALLGLPGIVQEPLAVPDGTGWALAIRPVLRASLTFDHRALDGGPVIAFLNSLKARIESL